MTAKASASAIAAPIAASIAAPIGVPMAMPAGRVAGALASARPARPQVEFVARGRIALVPIVGVLWQRGLTAWVGREIEALAASGVDTIVLDVHSPGGESYGLPELADRIYAARRRKRIVAVANGEALAGAYWIASQANELVVTPSGEVGSIGVVAMHIDQSRADERAGLRVRYIAAGKYKTVGNPHEPLTSVGRRLLREAVAREYDAMIEGIGRGRGRPAWRVRRAFGEGWIVGACEAVARGMADRVASLGDVIGVSPFPDRLAKGGDGIGADLRWRLERHRRRALRWSTP